MARKPRWEEFGIVNGCGEVRLFSRQYFGDFINQRMLDFRSYIWRGQRCTDWSLEPTLDRRNRKLSRARKITTREAHLRNFQFGARGRRGVNPPELSENDWCALGQHHGLDTPLLDWTTSPFAAAYFAFYGQGTPQTSRRAIYAVHSHAVESQSAKIQDAHKKGDRAPIVELVRPLADDNPRLINQGGLFTRAPDGKDLESWISDNWGGHDRYILMKITVPNADRALALRFLNRMNLNHLTLFQDLYGASRFCNVDLEIDKY